MSYQTQASLLRACLSCFLFLLVLMWIFQAIAYASFEKLNPSVVGTRKDGNSFDIESIQLVGLDGKRSPVLTLKISSETLPNDKSKQNLPLIVTTGLALLALASNVWISLQNYLLLKKGKWHEAWCQKLATVQEELFGLCIDSLSSNSPVEAFRVKLRISSLRSKISGLVKDDNNLIQCLSGIEDLLCGGDPYTSKEELFGFLTRFSTEISEVIRNGN